jgi:hypothetical protein
MSVIASADRAMASAADMVLVLADRAAVMPNLFQHPSRRLRRSG